MYYQTDCHSVNLRSRVWNSTSQDSKKKVSEIDENSQKTIIKFRALVDAISLHLSGRQVHTNRALKTIFKTRNTHTERESERKTKKKDVEIKRGKGRALMAKLKRLMYVAIKHVVNRKDTSTTSSCAVLLFPYLNPRPISSLFFNSSPLFEATECKICSNHLFWSTYHKYARNRTSRERGTHSHHLTPEQVII